MSAAALIPQTTFAEYATLDEKSPRKHEFLNGEIIAMAGGSPEHSLIATNLASALNIGLGPIPCRVFNSDLRIRVKATGLATYPDTSIVCGTLERDPEDRNTVTNPIVLAEVLSPSTEDYDRHQKFAHYRRIPSLREYLLVSQDEMHIEQYIRNPDGSWTLRDIRGPDEMFLPSVETILSLEAVYRKVFAAAR